MGRPISYAATKPRSASLASMPSWSIQALTSDAARPRKGKLPQGYPPGCEPIPGDIALLTIESQTRPAPLDIHVAAAPAAASRGSGACDSPAATPAVAPTVCPAPAALAVANDADGKTDTTATAPSADTVDDVGVESPDSAGTAAAPGSVAGDAATTDEDPSIASRTSPAPPPTPASRPASPGCPQSPLSTKPADAYETHGDGDACDEVDIVMPLYSAPYAQDFTPLGGGKKHHDGSDFSNTVPGSEHSTTSSASTWLPVEFGSEEWRALAPLCDKWGFIVEGGTCDDNTARREARLENRRARKWGKMRGGEECKNLMPEGQGMLSSARKKLLVKRVHKGIPDPYRALAWQVMSGARKLIDSRMGGRGYLPLKMRATAHDALPAHVFDQIELDLRRTYPDHRLWLPDRPHECPVLSEAANRATASSSREVAYSEESALQDDTSEAATLSVVGTGNAGSGSGAEVERLGGQSVGVQLLRSLLSTYAMYDPEVGYCQAMNFVAGVLLMYCAEDQAFWIYVQLMYGFGFRHMYRPGLPLLLASLDELKLQTARLLPKLHTHFTTHGIEPSLFATQWFMTFGLDRCFPFEMGVRLLDLIFFERSLKPVFRLAVAMLQHQQHVLLQLHDTIELMEALRELPSAIGNVDLFFLQRVRKLRIQLSPAIADFTREDPP